jgi:hypothetical protein
MRTRSLDQHKNPAAELKLLIIRQQELAAKLARQGKQSKASVARVKLLVMMNQLDIIDHCHQSPSATTSSME